MRHVTFRRLVIAGVLLISHTVVFFSGPYVRQGVFIATRIAPDRVELSEKEQYLTVIMAIPKGLANEDFHERCEWSKNYLVVQPNASWVCVDDGEFLGYTGFAFKLRPYEAIITVDR